MKKSRILKIISIGAVLMGLLSFVVSKFFKSTSNFVADWAYIESVGGLKLGEPKKIGQGSWSIPILCDVSGLSTITVKPTIMNSAIQVNEIVYEVRDDGIHLSMVLGMVVQGSGKTSHCPDLVISETPPGVYTVFYTHENKKQPIGQLVLK